MAILRIDLTTAFPEFPGGTLILDNAGVGGIRIDPALAPKLNTARLAIRALKPYMININAGKSNEERTKIATIMISHHDSGGVLPDEPALDV